MANVRAGVAYVDVRLGSIERFKKELKEKIESVGQETGTKIGTELGEGIEKGSAKSVPKAARKTSERFSQDFGKNLVRSGQVLRVGLIAWLAPAVVAAGPFIGGVLGSAIVAGLPIGVIAGGIALIAKHPVITKAWQDLSGLVVKDLKFAASSMIQPTQVAIGIMTKAWKDMNKEINAIFFNSAAFIVPLTTGITDGLKFIIQGIDDLVRNAGPVIKVLSDGFTRLGKAIGEMLTKISSDPEAIKGMSDALEDFIGLLVLVIAWLGNFIVSASRAYSQFKESWGAIKEWFSTVIVPSLKRAADQAVAVWNGFMNWINGLPKWFRDRWNSLTGIVSSALANTVGVTVSFGARIVRAVIGWVNGVVSAVGGLAGRLFSAGFNAMLGFFNGISSMGGRIIQRARDIANSVASTIASALAIFSPSRVMMDLGKMTMLGFEKGMEKNPVDINSYLPKGIPTQVGVDFGSPRDPQMDKDPNAALHIDNYYANENVDPWRQAEDWYFMVSARGGVA